MYDICRLIITRFATMVHHFAYRKPNPTTASRSTLYPRTGRIGIASPSTLFPRVAGKPCFLTVDDRPDLLRTHRSFAMRPYHARSGSATSRDVHFFFSFPSSFSIDNRRSGDLSRRMWRARAFRSDAGFKPAAFCENDGGAACPPRCGALILLSCAYSR